MPAISRIRFTNVIYENGGKRYNNEIFHFDGHSGAIILENGGGKTVFIQTALQAVVPHMDLADRKIKETLSLENGAAHIAIEWILNESPRRYAVTAVTLFIENNGVNSYKFVNEYGGEDPNSIEYMPFIVENNDHTLRPAGRGEILDYYQRMARTQMTAKMFDTIGGYHEYLENNFKIIDSEWRKIGIINSAEGDVDQYFEGCKTTQQLLNKILIPVVEEQIKGDEGLDFVKTFEKQREHFKKNKQLLEQIHESQMTKDQLLNYIAIYEKLDTAEHEYLSHKLETKNTSEGVKMNLSVHEEQLTQVEEKLKNIEIQERRWSQKKQSIDILLCRQNLAELTEELRRATERYNQEKDVLDDRASKKQNIEITYLREEIKAIEEQIKVSEALLHEMNEDNELSELLQRLQMNAGMIKGILEAQIEGYKEEKNKIEAQLVVYQSEVEEVERERSRNSDALMLLSERRIEHQTIMQRLQEETESLRLELALESNEIEESYRNWKLREKQWIEKKYQHEIQIREVAEEKEIENKRLQELLLQNEDLHRQNVICQNKMDEVNSRTESIKLLISTHLSQMLIGNIYEKQASIESAFKEKEMKSEQEREKALLYEREKSLLADQYQRVTHYTADPKLAELIEGLKEKVHFIQSGSAYFDEVRSDLSEGDLEQYSNFPYWATTIVTVSEDLELVRQTIEQRRDQMSHPVLLTSVDGLRRLFFERQTGITGDEEFLFPILWKQNSLKTEFELWKANVTKQSQELKANRESSERQLEEIRDVQKEVTLFFREFPSKVFEELKKDLLRSEEALLQNKGDIKKKKERILWLEDQQKSAIEKLLQIGKELLDLEKKLSTVEVYIKKEQELNQYSVDCKEVDHQYTEAKNTVDYLEAQRKRLTEIMSNLKDEQKQFAYEIRSNQEREIYEEVRNEEPVVTILSLKTLEVERKQLHNLINGKNIDREGIVLRISEKKADLKAKERDLELRIMEAEYPIENVESYYRDQLQELIEEIKDLTKKCNLYSVELQEQKTNYSVEKRELERLTKNCMEEYGEILTFEQDLISLQSQLEDEKRKIKKEKDQQIRNRYSLIPKIEEIRKNITDFEISNGKHGFLNLVTDHKVEVREVQKDEIQDLLFQLDQKQKAVHAQKEMVNGEKDRYKRYCTLRISDPKLKEMAIQVVEQNRGFTELKENAGRLSERIEQGIKLAEYNRTTSDQELQIFLEHLHTYVQSIVGELDLIQRKTKINVDGQLKQIFLFDIPTWDIAEGKEELRKHIDWIVDQLENRTGDEDEITTTKDLENWFSVKRLLQCTMGDQSIKVKCRKVTNDKKISSVPSSWEHSNQWSGGEKWSKNMTLFLSLLIYIAEKKQYLSANDKKSRTVILDNPFGKASSKHVLDPVFFIAERLGFQIIALTAHAEGEFIRNYFPVVYSCRLRPSSEPGKQIMTKEKEIHYAYLKEHDPKSLMRFQEIEQVSLFDAL